MADIGDKLRSAREAKGLSIEDIEKATKIQGRYLTAIEQDDFDKLPGDFYVRAFIRQYAQVVGLDGKQLLSEYHNDIPQAEPDEYVEDSIDNKSEEVSKTTSNKKKIWKEYLPRIIVGVGIILAVLVCYMVYAHFSASDNQPDNSANDVSVSSDNNTTKPKKRKQVKKAKVKIKQLSNNQYQVTGLKENRNLVVRAGNQQTNVSVIIDGVSQANQVLTSNQKRTIAIPESAKTMVVTFTNPYGATIRIGGKRMHFDPRITGSTLTFYIGKHKQEQSQTTENNSTQTNNNQTTTHSNTNTNTNQHNQGQNQSNGTTNNQQNGQTDNGQSGHETNQQTNNGQGTEANHSNQSTNNSNGGR